MRCISECATPESPSAGPRTHPPEARTHCAGLSGAKYRRRSRPDPLLTTWFTSGYPSRFTYLGALGEIGTPCSRFKTVSQSSFPELSEFSDRCSVPGRGPKAGQSRRLPSIDQTRGAKPARQGPDIREQLHGLAIHYRLRIQEIKKQMVADEQESVAPVIVRVRFHAVWTENWNCLNWR